MNDRLNLPSNSDIKKVLRFDGNKLPSFPQAAAKLLKASKDKTSSLTDLSKIVETDPGISVKVLEIVNSAMYGLGRKITALSEAVVFLGLDEIKKIAIGMTIFEKMFKSGNAKLFNRLHFWRHCISTAVLSMEIAREIKYSDPEEAYIAGLLHDIGKIFLDTQGKNNYGDFIQALSTCSDLIIEKERSIIGLGHDDVGAMFCSRWKLPEKLSLAVKYHHQPFEHLDLTNEEMQLISIVSLSNFLCWTQGIGSFDIIRPPILPPEVEKIVNLDKIDIIKCIQNMNKEVENISEFYHFIFPSTDKLRENLLWANLRLSKANTKYYYQEDPLLSYKDEVSIQQSSMPFDIDFDFGKPLAKAKSVKEVLDIVMYQVGRIFQPLHWSILLKDSKTSDMIFSVVVGSNKEKLQGAKLPKGEGVAGYIMETGKSLIIEDVAKDKHFSMRADKYSGFKTQSIIGTPLKTDSKTFGVIELINRISDNPFTSQDLNILASIAEYAAIAIERSYYNQAMTSLVTTDSLTGLKNRWSFERAVSNKDDMLRRYGSIFSMLIIDIARLLQAYETEKHDEVLKKLAGVLSTTKRREDDIFRYGEGAFIMLLPQTYSDGAKKAKERILKAFSVAILEKDTSSLQVNISSQTVSAGDSNQLKAMVGKFLSKSKTLLNEDTIADMEENLQPLLDEENRREIEEIQQKQTFGRMVSLGGEFTRLKTRETGHIRVERLSLEAIGFRISKSHRIQINDFLDIHFILDDIGKALVKRRIVVRSIKGNYIYADFYNPPPYAKKLGFYLMN
ncbi:MAG: HDOD domain-containing protein [Desulfobacula sp.]|nr:HDOD domain-containing protein [Desulfobacula sp.]